jgi:serine protease AprX
MKNRFFSTILLFYCLCGLGFAQSQGRYFVQFTDKNHNEYSLDQPEAFLSDRALKRREKYKIPVVQNDLPVSSCYLDSLKKMGLEVLNTSKWFNAATVEITDTLFSLDTLSTFSYIKLVERTKTLKSNSLSSSDNTLKLYNSDNYGQDYYGMAWWQIAQANGHYLHNQGYRGEGVLMAVLDAGFYNVDELESFDSAWQNNQIIATRDFVHEGRSFFKNSYHGMKVFSTIAGNVPGVFVGTAPKADFILCRTEDAKTEFVIEEDHWVAGAEYADSIGADIINSSLGYNDFDDTLQNHTIADMDGNTTRISMAADIAASKGMLVVTSAGNEGAKSWGYITAPADADSILTVGAVDSAGNYASFSSRGPTVDGRIKPNVAVLGQLAVIQYASGGFGPGNGTSFSSPILAGMAACLWQANPLASNMQIIQAIQESASRYYNPDSLTGYGIPNFRIADLILKSKFDEPIDTNKYLNVYPNPFSNEIAVELCSPRGREITVAIYDSLGKQVFSESQYIANQYINSFRLDLSGLKNGVYVLKLISGNRSRQKKIIKER